MRRKPKYTIEEIRQKVAPIAKRYGVARVYLFGSYARNEARAKSDVDLLIDKGKVRDLFRMSELYCALENSLETKIDLLTTCAFDAGDKFREDILKEEVLLYAEQA